MQRKEERKKGGDESFIYHHESNMKKNDGVFIWVFLLTAIVLLNTGYAYNEVVWKKGLECRYENGRGFVIAKRPGLKSPPKPKKITLAKSQPSDSNPADDDVTGRKSKESPPDVVGDSGAAGGDSASEGPG